MAALSLMHSGYSTVTPSGNSAVSSNLQQEYRLDSQGSDYTCGLGSSRDRAGGASSLTERAGERCDDEKFGFSVSSL